MGRPRKNNGVCKICGGLAERTINEDGVVISIREVCHICRNRTYRKKVIISTICEKCTWEGYCDEHHKDGNHNNNSEENIEILCPNCHRNLHFPLPDWLLKTPE